MPQIVFNYSNALDKYGSKTAVQSAIKQGVLFRVAKGVYSTEKYPSPFAVAMLRWPKAVITLDSAFYFYGLTDVIASTVHFAVPRSGARVKDKFFQAHYMQDHLLEIGVSTVSIDGVDVRIFSKERMLVELLRLESKLSYDYFREILSSYRDEVYSLDFRVLEQCIDALDRKDKVTRLLEVAVM